MDTFGGIRRFLADNRDNPALHVISGRSVADDTFLLPENEPVTHSARLVEGEGSLGAQEVPEATGSGFTHFLDGIQDSRQVCLWEDVPVVWGTWSACIRRRNSQRLMETHHPHCRQESALFFPFKLIEPEHFASYGLQCIDTSRHFKKEGDEDHPACIRQAAVQEVGLQRQTLERKLTSDWSGDAEDEWLLVDGSLPGAMVPGETRNMIGLIKSHQARYFTGEEQRRIMRLPCAERTSVFQPHRRTYQPVYSWYLRLRDNDLQDWSFGLIRVEAQADATSIEMADTVSGWILAERTPLSLPDGRWDRMIYPIRDCEQYLRSLLPGRATLESVFQR